MSDALITGVTPSIFIPHPYSTHLPIPNSSYMLKKQMQEQTHAAGEGRAQQVPPSPGPLSTRRA